MTTTTTRPAFGDRVKITAQVASFPAGTTAVVLEVREGAGTIALAFKGAPTIVAAPASDVTADLEWVTPREQAGLDAVAEVLRVERVGEQRGRRMRIARAVIAAAMQAVAEFDEALGGAGEGQA